MAELAHEAPGPASPEPAGIALQQASRPDSPDRGKLRVFISYSRDDLDFADQLDAALTLYGFECLIDRHAISGGEDWKRRLGNLISEADTVVFVLSPTSAHSDMCAWEVEEAARLNKRILPIICRALEGASPPPRLQGLNYIFFHAEPKAPASGFGTGLRSLVAALNTDFDWLREQTRYLQRATEWNAGGRPANRLLSGNDILEAKAWVARRPKSAPEPTALHLDFIRASEEEAEARSSEQRRQLEVMAAAQAEREKALREAEEALNQAADEQRKRVDEQRKRVRNTKIALVVVSILAVVAGLFGWAANQQLMRAQRNFEAATKALSTLIESVPKNVEPVAPLQTVVALMNEAREAISKFPPTEGASPQIRRYRAQISLALAAIEFDLGQFQASRDRVHEAKAMLTAVASDNPADIVATYHLARSQHFIGAAYYQLEDGNDESQDAYKNAILILTNLIRDHPADSEAWSWHLELAEVHQDYGDLLLDRLRIANDAKTHFELAIDERREVVKLGYGGSAVDYSLGWATNKLGDVNLRTGQRSDAIADFEHARDSIAALGTHLQDNKRWPNHLSLIYNNIGLLLRKDRRYGDAIEQFSRAIELTLQLTNRDPDNTDLRSVLGWTFDNAGETWACWAKSETENALDRLGKAREMLEKARNVRLTLAGMKPRWRQDLTYTDANLAMADALALEMAHKNLAAAAAYDRAANLSHQVANLNHEVPAASQRDDAFERTIELREWAAAAFMNAGASDEAREQLGKAIEDAKNHHGMAGDKEEESTVKRLEGLLRAIQK